jgi:predicted nucleotidyltransferase
VLGREDARQLERVVELVREVLGPDVLGVYLFGSAVLGGLRPESDLDLLAVSARRRRWTRSGAWSSGSCRSRAGARPRGGGVGSS